MPISRKQYGLVWGAINGAFLFCLYQGFSGNDVGFRNIAYFIAWTTIIIQFLATGIGSKKLAKYPEYPEVSIALSTIIDWIVIGFFIYYGAWITGIGYYIHWMLQLKSYYEVEKIRSKQ